MTALTDLRMHTVPQHIFIVDTKEIKDAFIERMPDWILEDLEEFFIRTLDEMIAASIAESLMENFDGTLPSVLEYKGKEYYAEYAANFLLDDRRDDHPTTVFEIVYPALEAVTAITEKFYTHVVNNQKDQVQAASSCGIHPLWYGKPRNSSTMFLEFHGDIRVLYWTLFGMLPED